MPSPFKHILVSRTDKIGDLILSLPVFQSLRASFPEARITALVSSYAREVVETHPDVDGVELVSRADTLPTLVWRFRRLECDAFLALYPRPWIGLAARIARIPTRVGTGYRWWSPFYNKKIYVHRSRCERHESDYNLDLVRALGGTKLRPIPQFAVEAADREAARALLKSKGQASGDRIVAVHPGSKGSALNWSPERYAEAVGKIARWDGVRILVTGGPGEEKVVQRLLAALPARLKPPMTLVDEVGLRPLAAVLKACHCLLSGSTGVMHLAAAVGTPTVSLFGGGPTTSPVRWGPVGNRSLVLKPDALRCPECREGNCHRHDPMDWVSVDRVVQGVKVMLDARGPRR